VGKHELQFFIIQYLRMDSRFVRAGSAGGGVGSKEAAAAALRRRPVESSSTGVPILQPRDYLGKHARPASGMRGSQRSPAPSAEPSPQNSKANAKPSSAKVRVMVHYCLEYISSDTLGVYRMDI
jgi:hypothetical protein